MPSPMDSSSAESSPSSHTSTRLSNGASIKYTTLQNPRTRDVFRSMVEGRQSWKTLRGGEVIWPPELETAPVSFEGVAAPPSSHFHGTDTPVSVANRAVTTATVPLIPKEGRMLACSQDGNFSKGSYVSASLAMVQKLPDGHCFLQFDIQCHPSPKFRVSRMDLDFTLRAKYPNSSPTIRAHAPKESIGARSAEAHSRKTAVGLPIKVHGVGVEVNSEFQVGKAVEHATIIRGSIRGQSENRAKWTVDENHSAMTGVPSHFCVALVVEYSSIFTLTLEMEAWQSHESFMKLVWPRQAPTVHVEGTKEIDVDGLEGSYRGDVPVSRTPENWKDWVPEITGDVRGSNVFHAQIPIRHRVC